MIPKARGRAARQEAFRRAAPNRASTTFGPEFDRAFAIWDAQRRRRRRLLSALALVAIAMVGGLLFARLAPSAARNGCSSPDARRVAGQCESVD